MSDWIRLSNTTEWSTDTLNIGESQNFCWENEARHKSTYCMIQEHAELIYDDKN